MHSVSRHKPYRKFSIFFLALALVMLAGTLASVSGCGEDDDSASASTASTTAATVGEQELTEEWLFQRAASKIGSSALVRDVSITESGADKIITVEVDRPELCHDGAVVGTVAVFAQNVMGILYKKYPEVADVDIKMYGTELGVISDDVAMQVSVDRETAKNIDWFEFNDETIFDLVTTYYMHPVIEESYRLEGAVPFDQVL